MRYVVGVIGFVLVFFVVYMVVTFALFKWSPYFLAVHFPLAVQGINNPVGAVLALLAGVSSFRASIKKKEKKESLNKSAEGDAS